VLEYVFEGDFDAQYILNDYFSEHIGRSIEEKDLACIRDELAQLDFKELMEHFVGILPYYNETYVDVVGVTDKYLSVIQAGMVYFGGAYPDKTTDYVTFERDSEKK